MWQLRSALVLSLALFSCLEVSAQGGAVVRPQPSKTPPTLPILYRSFLAYQLHLEQKADALKLEGKDGEDFRNHYKKVLGFSDSEFAKIHTSAVHLHEVLAAKDLEIHDLIKSAHAAVPKGPLPKGYVIPPPPPQLKALFTERAALVNTEIDTLHKQLTPAETAKLEQFLQKEYAPAVTVGTLPPHAAMMHHTFPEVK